MSSETTSVINRPVADPMKVQKFLQNIGLPRSVRDRIVVGIKKFRAPNEVNERAAAAAKLPAPDGLDVSSFRAEGFAQFEASALPGSKAAAAAAYRLFEQLRDAGKVKKPEGERKGGFLISLMNNDDLLADDDIAALFVSDEMMQLASCYFGEVPVLSSLNFWWSPPNESMLESQLYYYDGEDRTQLKILLNVNDIDETCGPFTFLPATQSSKLQTGTRHSQRLTDEVVDDVVGPDAAIRLMGPAGSVAAVDTSRCLHYGSRGNSSQRLILMAQFTRYLAPKASMRGWRIPGGETRETLGEAQRLVLNIAG